jgi:hypothetical protein
MLLFDALTGLLGPAWHGIVLEMDGYLLRTPYLVPICALSYLFICPPCLEASYEGLVWLPRNSLPCNQRCGFSPPAFETRLMKRQLVTITSWRVRPQTSQIYSGPWF